MPGGQTGSQVHERAAECQHHQWKGLDKRAEMVAYLDVARCSGIVDYWTPRVLADPHFTSLAYFISGEKPSVILHLGDCALSVG